jgi:hypothetical protein
VTCPGGAFFALSIDSEGSDVARWLVEKGVTCFVLKYRLVECETDDPTREVGTRGPLHQVVAPIIPLAMADGLAAIGYVRGNAARYGVTPNRIGIIGFSADGTVAASVAMKKTFAVVLNERNHKKPWLLQHPVVHYFRDRFPRFTKDGLLRRSDMARHFQGLEAGIMVRALGSWCRDNRLFWIPEHDGFLSTQGEGTEIKKRAGQPRDVKRLFLRDLLERVLERDETRISGTSRTPRTIEWCG